MSRNLSTKVPTFGSDEVIRDVIKTIRKSCKLNASCLDEGKVKKVTPFSHVHKGGHKSQPAVTNSAVIKEARRGVTSPDYNTSITPRSLGTEMTSVSVAYRPEQLAAVIAHNGPGQLAAPSPSAAVHSDVSCNYTGKLPLKEHHPNSCTAKYTRQRF